MDPAKRITISAIQVPAGDLIPSPHATRAPALGASHCAGSLRGCLRRSALALPAGALCLVGEVEKIAGACMGTANAAGLGRAEPGRA